MWTWSGESVALGQPLVASQHAVVNRVASETNAPAQPVIFKLGAGGGELGSLAAGSHALELQPPKIYSELNPGEGAANDHPLAFDVSVGDIRPGIPDVDWHYQPDYEENMKLPYSGARCCGLISRSVAIGDAFVYGSVGEHVYRYDLASPDGQRPILVSDSGLFVAGPYENRIYVGRPDGVWAVSFNGRYAYQVLVVPYRLPTVLADIVFSGGIAYAALTDGSIFAFQVDGGQPVIRAKVPCSQFAGISVARTRVLYACSAPAATMYAFPR